MDSSGEENTDSIADSDEKEDENKEKPEDDSPDNKEKE